MTEPVHETTDLYIAAFLKVLRVPMDMRWEGRQATWTFEVDIRGYMHQFLLGGVQVPAHEYAQAIRVLKDLVHS